MKKKEKASYRSMNSDELANAVADLRQKVQLASLERTYKEAKNTRTVRVLKKKLAVVQTIRKEKEQVKA